MITEDQKQELIDLAYKIIGEEKLPVPIKFHIRSPVRGTKTKTGSCYRKTRGDPNYKIFIYTRVADFYEDPNGTYTDNKTKKKLRRADVGKDRSIKGIMKCIAHEIAHLKFWNHNIEHTNYMEHILSQMIKTASISTNSKIEKWWSKEAKNEKDKR